jgi:hypothetical protein
MSDCINPNTLFSVLKILKLSLNICWVVVISNVVENVLILSTAGIRSLPREVVSSFVQPQLMVTTHRKLSRVIGKNRLNTNKKFWKIV